MLEIIKTIGSIMGLLSFPFFLYDRYAKWRPVASLTVKVEGARKVPCIRISNPTPYDIMVLGSAVKPKVYYLTENTETRDIIAGSMGRTPSFVLKTGESKELVIYPIFKNNLPLEIQPQRVDFHIYFRRGNATWLKQIPLMVCTSTDIIRKYGLEDQNSGL